MASTDAKPIPQKNVAFRLYFALRDANGDLITTWAGADSEVSKDGAAYSDCTNEATEIGTTGTGYIDLTSTEMNADNVLLKITFTNAGSKTLLFSMYPEEAGDIRVNVTAFGGTAGTFASGRPEVNMTHIAGSAVSTSTAQLGVNLVNIAGSAVNTSSAQLGVNVVNAAGTAWGSGAITAASIASSAITSAKFAAGAIDASAIADNAIDRATFAVDTGMQTIRSNTAQAGASTSITLDASASSTTDFYVGAWVYITGGTGVGQSRVITAYNGTTKVATVAPAWATNPAAASTFAILNNAQITGIQGNVTGSVGSVSGAVGSVTGAVGSVTGAVGSVTGNVGGNVTGSVGSVATGGITAASFAADAITAAKIAADVGTEIGTAVWATTTRILTAGTNIALAKGTGVTGFNDLDAAGVRSAVGLASANIDTQLAAIVADTNELQTDWVNGGRLDLLIDAIKAKTDTIPTFPSNFAALGINASGHISRVTLVDTTTTNTDMITAAGIRTAVGLASANLDTQIATLATASSLSTVAGYIDTEVAAIKGVTDKLDTAMVLDGAVYQFTANALELAPSGGGGSTDWTADERTAIRAILGIPGSGTTPADPTTGILDTIRDLVVVVDGVVDDILVDTGTTLQAELDGIQADTEDIQTRLPAALVSGRMDASVGAYQSGLTPLQPTVAGRTLDVSTTGEAGIDWANIGSPTTTNVLSGTTISSSQAVASVSGSVGSVTGNVGGNVAGNVSGTVGSVVGNVGGNVTGSVGSVAAGGITAASLASATITAAKFGSGAIDAAALASDAVAEIADGVWDEALSGHLGVGSTGEALNAAGSAGDPWTTTLPGSYTGSQAGKMLSDILVDTGTTLQAEVDDIQARLPAALVSGRMDASVGAYQSGLTPLQPTVAGRTLDVSVTGEAGIDWANVGSPTTAVGLTSTTVGSVNLITANGITATSIAADAIGASELAADAIAEIQSGLATAANLAVVAGYIDTEIAAIKAKTDLIPTFPANFSALVINVSGSIETVENVIDVVGDVAQIGDGGVLLNLIPWNAAWDTEVQSECADALTAYDPPTNAEMEARTLAAASYGTAANQTTILARLGSWTGSGINTVLGAFRALMAKASALTPTDISTGTTFDNTTDSLEAVRDRGDSSWITGSGSGGSSQAVIGSTNAITRNINESLPIQFTWNSASATITGTVELGVASAVACQGAVSFVRTDAAGKHWYQLAYDADDRPTVAGLARYVFTDGTDYLTVPVQFTEVAGGTGGGTVLPTSATQLSRVEGTEITAFVNENLVISQSVYDASSDPVNLSAYTLKFVIATKNETHVLTITSGINVTGADSNTYSLTLPDTFTDTLGSYQYSLRDASSDIVLAHGPLLVRYAATE